MQNKTLLQRNDPLQTARVDVGDKYIVADCGGGTVDLTVHQIEQPQGTLKELYKASGECRTARYGHMLIIIIIERHYVTPQFSEYIINNGSSQHV